MENNLALTAVTPALGVPPTPASAPTPTAPASVADQMQNDVADLRLIIEKDHASGLFIYKTIDRRTGDVLLQLPREEVVRMYQAEDYAAGKIIKTGA